jgi:hypothetical protein
VQDVSGVENRLDTRRETQFDDCSFDASGRSNSDIAAIVRFADSEVLAPSESWNSNIMIDDKLRSYQSSSSLNNASPVLKL